MLAGDRAAGLDAVGEDFGGDLLGQLALPRHGFVVADGKGNVVKVDTNSGAMTIEAKGQLTIKAASIVIEAASTMDIKSSGTMTIRGSTVNIN